MFSNDSLYAIFPKIVLSGQETTIRIVPRMQQANFTENTVYQITLYPVENLDSAAWDWAGRSFPGQVSNGSLQFSARFESEQKYIITVSPVNNPDAAPLEFTLYCVAEDLYRRIPYKGDMHMHSKYSDGIESPAYIAAMCRKIGLDFMALTDHHQYDPSVEAQNAFEGVNVDLLILRGEEVHPPQNPIHILNVGGCFSINALFKNGHTYQSEVAKMQANMGVIPHNANPYWFASAHWCFDKIRDAGGLGVFCHPDWFADRMVRIPESLTQAIFETQPYDAYELIGGYHRYEAASNVLQVARYHEEALRGRTIPIVGVSDAHGCHRDLFGWYYTLVFSPALDFTNISRSIKDLYSVAVEAIPGEAVHVYGPLRLVKYTYFLLSEIMPEHDALCQAEGDLMLAYQDGEAQARMQLNALKGQVERFWQRNSSITGL